MTSSSITATFRLALIAGIIKKALLYGLLFNAAPIEKAAGHVLAMSRIALHHLAKIIAL